MTQDEYLGTIFGSLDDDFDLADMPPYSGRLWSELEQTMSRRADVAPVDRVESIYLHSTTRHPVAEGGFRQGAGWAMLVAAALLVIGLWVSFDGDHNNVTTRDDPPTSAVTTVVTPTTTAVPTLPTPADACGQYATASPTLVEIEQLIDSGRAMTSDFSDAEAALTLLREALEASGSFDASGLRPIDMAMLSLGQSAAEFERGQSDRAVRSAQIARRQLEVMRYPASGPATASLPCLPLE